MELIDFDVEILIRMLVSFVVGAVIGFEREYHSKAAGLRTMIMICLGSTLFTLVSLKLDPDSTDRVASNIITGIGFLGAGVIFKDGLTISGITTATTIWISAALGMAIGAGEYFIAMAGSVIVIMVLSALQPITRRIEKMHQSRVYRITYVGFQTLFDDVNREISRLKLKSGKQRDFKDGFNTILFVEVRGPEKVLNEFNAFLRRHEKVDAFEF